MKRLRFSLLGLLGVIALIAVACAALRSASEIWGSAAFTLTVAALFVALVGVIFRQRASRAFWGGFALLGWGYLLLVFGPWFKDNVSQQLLTTKLLDYLQPKLQRSTTTPAVFSTPVTAAGVNGWTASGIPASGIPWPANTGAGVAPANTDLDGDGIPDVYVTRTAPAPTWTSPTTFTTMAAITLPSPQHFMQVGHSLWALLIASAGGLLARYFYDRRARPKQEEGAGT